MGVSERWKHVEIGWKTLRRSHRGSGKIMEKDGVQNLLIFSPITHPNKTPIKKNVKIHSVKAGVVTVLIDFIGALLPKRAK